MSRVRATIDGNEATALVAYKLAEVIAIYPITPATTMGELADGWAAAGRPNLWGAVPAVVEMQSEGGAAGALHGAMQAGALATTFTASQGLLLMIPNMYKIAGELTPAVFHVAARAIATQALSIFGDHSDAMAVRTTGWAMLSSGSVQEAHDLALVAHAATLEARVPFVHFFDGFRTSHEINTVERLDDDDLRALIDEDAVQAHRARALNPDAPTIRGTAQNPDVFFQTRERANRYYNATPAIVQAAMDRLAARTGRQYRLFDYSGAEDAERVIVIMGSGGETVARTVDALNARGEKVGVLRVRLFRPFSIEHFLAALPATVQRIAVLDRCKEPGAAGEPLFLDVVAALAEGVSRGLAPFARMPRLAGGRYGLASKEFTPAMVRAVFDELDRPEPRTEFTVGIDDDLTRLSLSVDSSFSIEPESTRRAVFWGLGSDGTVSANKDSVKIIAGESGQHAQCYIVHDSKKSGSVTVSHLRFGPEPIRAPYLIDRAGFVAVHQFPFLERYDVLREAAPGATLLLNAPYPPEEVWQHLPVRVQEEIIRKRLRLYTIDAHGLAKQLGMGGYINRIMQTCFFALGTGLPVHQAVTRIKRGIVQSYGAAGDAVVQRNFAAVDAALEHLHPIAVPERVTSAPAGPPPVSAAAPEFVRDVLGAIIAGHGDRLPVSAMPEDGVFPTATTRWEKRNIAQELPVWDADACIQCGKCVLVCPHAAIREKVYEPALLAAAPATFKHANAHFKEFPGQVYTLQVAPEDCTGCALCVEACPVRDKRAGGARAIAMAPQAPLREPERQNWDFFLSLPVVDRDAFNHGTLKNSQLLEPLFEFSGACAGCGETPYIKLATQLFGDRMVVANATGCSSIYGGNLPTTPWATDAEGHGPAWANSLFEDNAEFGMGMRVAIDEQEQIARRLLRDLIEDAGAALAGDILDADQSAEAGIRAQRARVATLKQRLAHVDDPRARNLESLADALVRRSVWIIGGDGWAYDIGFGGLDHVIASGRNVNVLVLDTEVYSNTGGQASKATPRGAVARFAARGKATAKKDLGMLAMAYGNVYVARVAMGANDRQVLKAFQEAEAYDGPSLIIAYAHCIAHGIEMRKGLEQQRLAVLSGAWPLYRFNPALVAEGKNPLTLDSPEPSIPVEEYAYNEVRYQMLRQADAEAAAALMHAANADAACRRDLYRQLAQIHVSHPTPPPDSALPIVHP